MSGRVRWGGGDGNEDIERAERETDTRVKETHAERERERGGGENRGTKRNYAERLERKQTTYTPVSEVV